MTPTTDSTATDAQHSDQSTGQPASADASAESGAGQAARQDETADRQHHERTVVVGDDTTKRETVVREGVAEVASLEAAVVGTVRIPAVASPAEADAIVAAVREHLVATGSASAETDTDAPARWVAAGRIRGVEPDPGAVLDDTDADPWIAASRTGNRR